MRLFACRPLILSPCSLCFLAWIDYMFFYLFQNLNGLESINTSLCVWRKPRRRGHPTWQMLQFRFSFQSFSSKHNGISKGISKAVLNWFKLASCHKAVCSQVSQRWLRVKESCLLRGVEAIVGFSPSLRFKKGPSLHRFAQKSFEKMFFWAADSHHGE